MALDNARSQIAHLLRRAGFGATEAELDLYTQLGFGATVDQLLNPEQVDDSAPDQLLAPLAAATGDPKKIEPAKFWWFNRMLYTQRPLQEKMTLFWHNHFATANSKVNNSVLMLQQIQLFRDSGLNNFESLLQKVTRDPAMLIWLDNRLNRKGAPNENYAREVQELFTVGIGNYTEQDIHEAARAFTERRDKSIAYAKSTSDDLRAHTTQSPGGIIDAYQLLLVMAAHSARHTAQVREVEANPNYPKAAAQARFRIARDRAALVVPAVQQPSW